MFVEIKRIDRLKGLKDRLESELKTQGLPAHRKVEIESYLFYIQVQIDYIQGKKNG